MTSIKQHKYALIENDIIDRINSGTLKPGDKVESVGNFCYQAANGEKSDVGKFF